MARGLGRQVRALLTLALILPGWVAAQAPASMEAVAEVYFNSQTYCDSGMRGQRDLPAQERFREETFERCASRDGRFKRAETFGAGSEIRWSDGKSFFRYLPYNRRYQKVSLDDPVTYDLYRNRAEIYPVFIFEVFSSEAYRFRDPAARAEYLRSFVRNAALSDAQYSVFERFPAGTKYGERVRVLNADRTIARWEYEQGGVIMRYVQVSSHHFDRPLTDADLSHPIPLLAPYSLMNDAPVFIGALIAGSGLLGLFAWGLLFRSAADLERVRAKRRLLWKLQFWVFGVAAVLLVGLGVAVHPGGGHPPAIVFVFALGAWAAVAFAMSALFTLASYAGEWLARKR